MKTILKYLIFLFYRICIFKSAGFIDHWINTEYRKILNINVDDFDFSEVVKQEYDSLNLYQLQSTLYLLIFGNLLALFSLFYEFIKKILLSLHKTDSLLKLIKFLSVMCLYSHYI